MGRREQRAEMQRTWMVYEPVQKAAKYTRKDFDDASARAEAQAVADAAETLQGPPPRGDIGLSRRTYLPALAAVAVEERHKSNMRE